MRTLCLAGIGWALLLPGCADPCADDGLVQSEASECPAAVSQGGTDSDTDSNAETDAASASASDSASATANSASASEGSDTDSATASASASASDSDTESATESNSASNTDSDSASDTDGDSETDGSSETDGDSDSDTTGPSTPYCEDTDDDGFGDPDACVDVPDGGTPPDGTVPNGDDCDDDDDNTFPGAAELDSETECMQDEDGDGWGDDDPADGVTAGSDCSDDGVDPCAVLITQDGTADNTYDQDLINALQGEGYEVLNFADTDVVLEDGNGVDVVVISETALSTEIAGTMRDTPAPMICLEGLVWDDLSMAAEPTSVETDDVSIADDANPLSGGLSGTVTVVSGAGAGVFNVPPPPGATIIATLPGQPDVVEFTYDVGDVMLDDFEAPNRRVGLGFDADQGPMPTVNIEPDGITLFLAALDWATGG